MFQLVIFNLAGLTLKETTMSTDQPVVQHSIYQSLLIQEIAVFLAQWKELGHLVSVSWLFKPGQHSPVSLQLLLQLSSGLPWPKAAEGWGGTSCKPWVQSQLQISQLLLALSMRLLITLHYEDSQRDKATRKVFLLPEHRVHLRNPCEGWILQRGAASEAELQAWQWSEVMNKPHAW